MKIKNAVNLFVILLFFAFFSSCTGYNKLLKSTDAELKFTKAMELYEKEEYLKALTLFEQLIPIYRGNVKEAEINYYYAYCNYYLGDYIIAGYHFRNFSQTYGLSQWAEECQFMGAYCYYLDSPRFTLDQENTLAAISQIQLFVNQYPQSPRLEECNRLLDELRDKLAQKSFEASKMYYNLEYYKSAITALKNTLKEFPDANFKEELMFLIFKSAYLYADNSVDTKQEERYEEALKEYKAFTFHYKEGKFVKDAEKMYSDIIKKLEVIQNKAI